MGEMSHEKDFFGEQLTLAFRRSDCRLESLSDHSANESAMRNYSNHLQICFCERVFADVKEVKKQIGA